ncbi:hypothetical protein KFE80_07385 [bacterium SCSIO 12696]|nr:hypothetical protein KFE80_07385 [bacterium SCSIO 12696]
MDIEAWVNYHISFNDHSASFSLPSGGRLTVSPVSEISNEYLNKDFLTILDVGYDYKDGYQSVPGFRLGVQITKYPEGIMGQNAQGGELLDVLLLTFNKLYSGSVSYKEKTREDLTLESIGRNIWVYSSGKNGESYSMNFTECCFISVNANYYGKEYLNESWLKSRKEIFRKFVENFLVE